MKAKRPYLAALAVLLLLPGMSHGQSRIKDLAEVEGLGTIPLVGYGLVVGLEGTGDSQRSLFTNQALSNMLERFGISVNSDKVRPRNVAGVMVTAMMNPFAKMGQRVDVNVSSLGDSRSLQGGTLLLTPLAGADEHVYGVAQGPISIGGYSVESEGVSVRQNAAAVGKVPGGLLIEREPAATLTELETFRWTLRNPDFTTSRQVADVINNTLGMNVATPLDPVSIDVIVPPEYPNGAMGMIVDTETLLINVDVPARVVINERTGTVVIGQSVRLSSVAISHGALSISITNTPVVSQPGAFSQGQTSVQRATSVQVQEQGTGVRVIQESANVGDVAGALNSLGVTPRDIIAIFQALKTAGALQADLVII